MSTEAMKLALALEALEETYAMSHRVEGMKNRAMIALREALAQPQQEPVAWMHEWEDGEKIPMLKGRDDRNQDKPKTVRPLVYGDTPPQPAPVQQEPVSNVPGLAADESAFIRWALKNKYDTSSHPMFFVMLDPKTYEARMGWKAAVAHYVLAAAPQPAQQPAPVQQEPWGACVSGRVFVGKLPEHARKFSDDEGVPIQWLYTSPHPAQQQQEPVAWANPNDLQNFDMKVRTNAGPLHTVPLYTSPPARKPLTDEQIFIIKHNWITTPFANHLAFARAIESAHGIKEQP